MTAPTARGTVRERPILFSAPMVLALLAGTKTQTRRIVNPPPNDDGLSDDSEPMEYGYGWRDTNGDCRQCPYGRKTRVSTTKPERNRRIFEAIAVNDVRWLNWRAMNYFVAKGRYAEAAACRDRVGAWRNHGPWKQRGPA